MTSVFPILIDISICAEQSWSKHAHASSIEKRVSKWGECKLNDVLTISTKQRGKQNVILFKGIKVAYATENMSTQIFCVGKYYLFKNWLL
jgi:hypothetical protein